MTDARSVLGELSETLAVAGARELEVYLKQGRSRRFALRLGSRSGTYSHEAGWAVRAGGDRGSLFTAGTDLPAPDFPWPPLAGPALRLPPPARAAEWQPPADLEAPLVVAGEAWSVLEGIERALSRELPGARLVRADLEDGSSRASLANSRGVEASFRGRAASLYLEAIDPERGGDACAHLQVAAREAKAFQPAALARRLADLLTVLGGGSAPTRDRGELLIAPPVGARLLAGLLPLLVGPGARARAAALAGEGGRIASKAVTVVDDGRLAGGVLEAPRDGEGVPTRRLALVERGVFRQPLLSWTQGPADRELAAGCTRRPGWRDAPAPGPTHLFLKPDEGVAVPDLLAEVQRGYYLLDVSGAGRFDLAADRFALPVCGFVVRAGQAVGPLAGAWLHGGVGALLRGVQALARDLTFQPLDGLLGSPSMLVGGLEIRDSA